MPAFITTFYSYKGGVGRTLLAANIAYLLAQQEKTLIWDMDIEAPGLHHIPALKSPSGAQPKSGFLDWLHRNPPTADVEITPKALTAFLQLPYCAGSISSNLYVLPAMGSSTQFATLYQTIDWLDCLSVNAGTVGLALLSKLLAALAEQGFKHIVFDSRTGITDIGGLLAGALPHMTVLVGGYGVQNTKGLAGVWAGLQRAVVERNLKRLLVASPIPKDDIERRKIGEDVWREAFTPKPDASIIEVPFDQALLFGEQLLANTQPGSLVAQSYCMVHDQVQAAYEEWLAMAASEASERAALADPSLVMANQLSSTAKGKTFEDRVAHLLRLLGYEVEREQLVDSNRVDLIARKRGDFGKSETYLVECKDLDAAVPKDVIDKLNGWLADPTPTQWRASGMVIASTAISPAALKSAKDKNITALTYDELERSLFDFSPYLRRLRQRYEASPLARYYVDQQVMVGMQGEAQELLPYAQAWATGQGRRLWLLLGDYGTGKSSFVQRFAYELASNCAKNPSAPIPLAIDLKLFPNVISLEQLIQEHLKTEVQAVLNPEIVLHLFSAGRVVLLLDSFDEMGVAQIGRAVEEQFRKLASATARAGEMFDVVRALDLDDDGADDVFDHGAPWRRLERSFARAQTGSRMLITSRSHFFKDSSATENAANPQDSLFAAAGDSLLGKAARSFEAQIDEVPPFTPGQIAEYLTKRLGAAQGAQALGKINQLTGGAELAAVPQLLDIMVQSLPELMKQGGAVNQATLYLTFTNKWLDGFRLQHGEIAPEQMRLLLEQVACSLWAKEQNRIHYAELPELLKLHPTLMRGLDPVRVDLELRTAAFLVRSPDGFYRFSHRSFLEFFYARAILRGIQAQDWHAALSAGVLNPAAMVFLVDFVKAEPALTAAAQGCINNTLTSNYHAMVSENALRLALYSNAGLRLPTGVKLAGADLAHFNFEGAQLAHADLRGADASGADFSHANLQYAKLSQAKLCHAKLDFANLQDCTAEGADFTRSSGAGLNASHGNFTNACFIGSQLIATNFSHAVLEQANFTLTQLARANFSQAANLASANFSAALAAAAQGLPAYVSGAAKVPRLRGMLGHIGIVTACAFSPDGSQVLTAGQDGSARLWNTAIGRELRTFAGHKGFVFSCAFTPDGSRVLTAGGDGSARLWNAATGQQLRVFAGHELPVLACTFSRDGARVLTASRDGSARLWDTETGKQLRTFSAHEGWAMACTFSPDDSQVLTAGQDGSARLWNADTGAQLQSFIGHNGWVTACAFSSDSSSVLTAGQDGSARLWNADTGAQLRSFMGHEGDVYSCTISPDGASVLTAGMDGTRLWNAITGVERRSFIAFKGHTNASVFSPDGASVLTAGNDGRVRQLSSVTGAELRSFSREQSGVMPSVFSPNGAEMLVVSGDGSAQRWSTEAGNVLLQSYGATSSWLVVTPSCNWSGVGVLTEQLIYEDAALQIPEPRPSWWIAPHWRACDLPELRVEG